MSGDIYRAYKKKKGKHLFISNDLEEAALKKAPLVGKLKAALEEMGLTHSLVSGSGPSVFSLFGRRKEAVRAKKTLIKHFPFVRNKGWQIFIIPTT